jgi:hypothetical protein
MRNGKCYLRASLVRGTAATDSSLLPTPIASDWRSGKCSEATLNKNSRPLREIAAQGQVSGQLNPEFVELLMGFPTGWSDCEHLETQ